MVKRKKPTVIFHNSMGDTFHKDAGWVIIRRLFWYIKQSPQHTHLILTKRISNALRYCNFFEWVECSKHFWLGVTVCNQDELWKLDILREIPAKRKFVSFEPLLTAVKPDLAGIDWVIVGGESGPGARPMNPNWVRSIRDQCVSAGVPFFFKQWGGVRKKENGRVLDWRIWDQTPKIN